MLFSGSKVLMADNSGGSVGKCVCMYGSYGRKYGNVGDKVLVSIQSIKPNKKMKKGSLHSAVIVRTKKGVVSRNGNYVRCNDNAVVLLNTKGVPLGTRVMGPVMEEVRMKGLMKVVSLASSTV